MCASGLFLGRGFLGASALGLGVLFDQAARAFDQFGAVVAALVHVLHPFDFQSAGLATEILCFFRADSEDGVFVVHGSLTKEELAENWRELEAAADVASCVTRAMHKYQTLRSDMDAYDALVQANQSGPNYAVVVKRGRGRPRTARVPGFQVGDAAGQRASQAALAALAAAAAVEPVWVAAAAEPAVLAAAEPAVLAAVEPTVLAAVEPALHTAAAEAAQNDEAAACSLMDCLVDGN